MRILYATDGSEGGLTPARFLASLPLPQNQDVYLHIVTVVDHDNTEADGSPALAAAETALGSFPAHITRETAQGDSTSEIVDALLQIADADADLDFITVGASGQSAIGRFFLGSVAESAARYARQPVLITRPPSGPLHEIVVGLDGSDCSRAAAEFIASRFPLPTDCVLRLVSVVPQPFFDLVGNPMYSGPPNYLTLELINNQARKKASDNADSLADILRSTSGQYSVEVEPVVLGNPAVELVRIAQERGAELIVVGSHGLTGIDRFLLGSVSERVLRHAHCSVLVVKQRITGKGR